MPLINNRYQLIQQIGEGSQGFIVRGEDTKAKKPIVVKLMDISTEEGMLAFSNEYTTQSTMAKSKHICGMIDGFQIPSEGIGMIIMKQYQSDLFAYCFSKQKISPNKIKQIFRQVCSGVSNLHSNNIAHLDIKPENILLDSKGNAVLCDFGCSFSLNSSKMIATLQGRGTKPYTAPEVNLCDEFDPYKADIYSLGVLLHVVVTGFFPKEGDLTFAAQNVDPDCYSLLKVLLVENPEERVTIKQLLNHKYLAVPTLRLPKFLRR